VSTRRPRVIGLDLSLTSTGVSDGQSRHAIQTDPTEALEARLDRVVRGVVSFALSPTQWTDTMPYGMHADLAVIEAGAFSRGAQSGAAEVLSGLRLMVRHRLWRLGVPYAMVPPSTLKLYTTGYGKATKQQMVAAVDVRYRAGLADVKVKDGRYDMADALGLAAMGYDHLDRPLYEHGYETGQPGPHRDSLNAVCWPDLLSDD
jgi:Holliday junction resolvasome RuvABC endonuclease subunit